METPRERLMHLMLSLYLRMINIRTALFTGYEARARKASKRASEFGGFFSENFLYLAVFSIPVAFLFFLLARKYIWPYAQDNIFPCFDGNGENCFSNFGGDSFSNQGP